MMSIQGVIISASVTLFAVGLLAISLASYRKYRKKKLLFISVVFIILLLKGFLYTSVVFFPQFPWVDTLLYSEYSGLFDLAILVLLFIATVKR